MNRLLLTALICLSLIACGKQDGASADAANEEAAPSAASTAPTTSGSASAETSASTTEAMTGVAACDEFLEAYKTCVAEKVPEGTREIMAQGLAQRRQAWLDMLKDESTKTLLPEICARAKESTRTVLEMYGCKV